MWFDRRGSIIIATLIMAVTTIINPLLILIHYHHYHYHHTTTTNSANLNNTIPSSPIPPNTGVQKTMAKIPSGNFITVIINLVSAVEKDCFGPKSRCPMTFFAIKLFGHIGLLLVLLLGLGGPEAKLFVSIYYPRLPQLAIKACPNT